MNNTLNLYMKLHVLLYNELDRIKKLDNYINRLTNNDIITIHNFAFEFELSQETATEVLDTLCELKILNKQASMYRCPNCGVLIGVLTMWDEGDDLTCYNCGAIHPNADSCDTETVYSLCTEPKLKIFVAEWLDRYEKDSNDNPLPRKANVVGYTKSDAESVIDEYFHYIPRSIKVSPGIELENKMLISEYN